MKNDMMPAKSRTFDSMKAASAVLGAPMRVLQAAKRAGCPAFRSNRVYESELLAWIEAHPDVAEMAGDDPRDEKIREEVRKLRLANDAKEGRLVEIAWVLSCYQRSGTELDRVRAKSEAEDPLRFAAVAGDVAGCREVVQGMWDAIMRALQDELARPFEEAAKAAEG